MARCLLLGVFGQLGTFFGTSGDVSLSAVPVFISYGKVVQLVPIVLPLWHEQIHHRHKTRVVAGLKQLCQFMHHGVLQALGWLFGQVGVQADGMAVGLCAQLVQRRADLRCAVAGNLY